MRRPRSETELLTLRCSLAACQNALTQAHQRIRELETTSAAMNTRYAEAVERGDELESRLAMILQVDSDRSEALRIDCTSRG